MFHLQQCSARDTMPQTNNGVSNFSAMNQGLFRKCMTKPV